MQRRQVLVVALVCCLAVAFAPAVGATVAPAETAAVAERGEPVAGSDSGETAIASDGATDDDTVERLVRFESEQPTANESIVEQLKTQANESQAPLQEFADETGGVTVANGFWLANAALVNIDTGEVDTQDDLDDIVEDIEDIEGVIDVREHAEFTRPPSPDDTAAGASDRTAGADGTSAGDDADLTYGLEQIRVTPVWETVDTRGDGASVAVLDTGVDAAHPDIDLAKWAEFDGDGNEVDSEPQDYDDSGHGTHASGTATGGAASGTHVGVAPAAALFHGAVLTDCSGACSGTFAQITEGMEWAVENDADVLSMSLGAEGYFDEFIEPVRNAELAGTAVVAAVGNSGEGTSNSPANVYDAISVGATDEDGDVASFSAGEEIDTVEAWTAPPPDWPAEYTVPSASAPGQLVLSTEPGGEYGTKSGTSMATPHVAGAAALLQSATAETVSPDDMETALEATATKPDDADAPPGERDTRYGAGIVDVPAAIVHLAGPVATFDVDPPSPAPDEEATVDASDSLGAQSYEWDFTGDGETDATGETATHTFQERGPANVTLTVTDDDDRTATETRSLFVGLEPVVGDQLPRDLDGDGLYRDIDGDGEFTIFDVQALFENFNTDPVQENAAAFDFDGDGDVDIFDVQQLFNDLATRGN